MRLSHGNMQQLRRRLRDHKVLHAEANLPTAMQLQLAYGAVLVALAAGVVVKEHVPGHHIAAFHSFIDEHGGRTLILYSVLQQLLPRSCPAQAQLPGMEGITSSLGLWFEEI